MFQYIGMGKQASLDFQKMQRGWMEQQYQYLYRGTKYYINDNFKITGTKPADTGGKVAEYIAEIFTIGTKYGPSQNTITMYGSVKDNTAFLDRINFYLSCLKMIKFALKHYQEK